MIDFETKRVGFWIEDRKWKKLSLDTLSSSALSTHNFIIRKIETFDDLEDCEVLFVKGKKIHGKERDTIYEHLYTVPDIIQIDHVAHLEVLYNRKCTFDKLSEVELDLFGCTGVKIMPSFSINSETEVESQLVRHDISFPLICKPNILTGVEQDHDMIVVFKREHLSGLQNIDKFLFQPLIKHQIMLKVSVLGKEIHVATRPSIDKIIHEGPPIRFYTFTVAKIKEENAPEKVECLRETIDSVSLKRMIEIIRTKFNISLFSLDLIIDQSGKAFIIDINSFPGYSGIIRSKGLAYFHSSLLNVVLDKLKDKNSY